ncbi:MAG TPA: FadR/GntR family transcriptional regulator [bacterium]|nr:FadR/GntR family transcriptional regulator [bacterium]
MASPPEPLFQPVRRSRLYEGIVRQIQDLIADKHLQPGDRLPGERELADSLAVSRASAREALRVLHFIGVVDVRPGEGTFVSTTPPTPIDPSMYSVLSERTVLLDLLEARRLLEEGIVALAARRATKDDLGELAEFLRGRGPALASGKQDVESDLQFHTLLAEATGNMVLVSAMRHLNEMWLQAREKTGRKDTSPHRALRFHQQILAAVRRRQPAVAQRILRQHLDDMRSEIES